MQRLGGQLAQRVDTPLGMGGAAAPDPLRRDLVAYWLLNEVSGTRYDAIGSSHLTDNNTVTSAAGKLGTAAQFVSANSEYLSCASNAALQTGDIDFTVAAWIRANSLPLFTGIVCKDGGASTREYRIDYSSSQFRFIIFDAAGSVVGSVLTQVISLATWYLVIGWHDSVNNKVWLQANDGTPVSANTSGAPSATGAEFRIGQYPSGNAWDGLIDNTSIWKRVLPADERTSLWNGGNGRLIRL